MGLTVVGNESWLGGGVVLEETKFAYCLAMLAVSDWIDFWEDGKGAIIFFPPFCLHYNVVHIDICFKLQTCLRASNCVGERPFDNLAVWQL